MGNIDTFYVSPGISFAVTLACSLLLVCTKRWHGRYSLDAVHGVQKAHLIPTPRIGGAGILAGLWVALANLPPSLQDLLAPLLVAALPAFAFGLVEDLTRNVSIRARLFATAASGALCWWLTDAVLRHTGFAPLDALLSWLPFAVVFTAFAVSGVANAVNIIDGFNGLASGAVLISMGALGMIAFGCGDLELARLCLVVWGATAGFFIVNFPFGKLFLGDGGAYLLGFLLAWISVMLVDRNPAVSAWAPLLACAYPVFETVFTIVRRLWTRRHPGFPDSRHLHSLIRKNIAMRYFKTWPAALRNSSVSPFAWTLATIPAAFAVNLPSAPGFLAWAAVASFLLYCVAYAWVASLGRYRSAAPDEGGQAQGRAKDLPLAPVRRGAVG